MSENTQGDTDTNIAASSQRMSPRRIRAKGRQEQDIDEVEQALINEVYAIGKAGYPAVGEVYLPHLAHFVNSNPVRTDELFATLLNNYGYLLRMQATTLPPVRSPNGP